MIPRGDTAEDLRAVLAGVAEVAADGSSCPPAERLVDSARGELDRAGDEQVVLHLAQCTACAAGWRVARALGRAPVPAELPRRAPRTWTRWAAAAVVVAALGGGLFYLMPLRHPEPIWREQRETAIDSLVQESEPLPRDGAELRWVAAGRDAIYDVVVTDERMRTLARAAGLGEPRYRIPATALEGLEPGATIYWQVTAHTPDGRTIESATFTGRVR